MNVDNCHEGWVPATFLEPLGEDDHASKPEKLAPGKGMTSQFGHMIHQLS